MPRGLMRRYALSACNPVYERAPSPAVCQQATEFGVLQPTLDILMHLHPAIIAFRKGRRLGYLFVAARKGKERKIRHTQPTLDLMSV
jgi:hypothetical protein